MLAIILSPLHLLLQRASLGGGERQREQHLRRTEDNSHQLQSWCIAILRKNLFTHLEHISLRDWSSPLPSIRRWQPAHTNCFASRTLAPAERNNSQLEREGLALVCGVKRFNQLLYTPESRFDLDNTFHMLQSLHRKFSILAAFIMQLKRSAMLSPTASSDSSGCS